MTLAEEWDELMDCIFRNPGKAFILLVCSSIVADVTDYCLDQLKKPAATQAVEQTEDNKGVS